MNDIKTQQTIMWLNRIKANIETFKKTREEHPVKHQLFMIRQQYSLLQALTKVISGESYLNGVDKVAFEKKQ